jgi:hypothetical protein
LDSMAVLSRTTLTCKTSKELCSTHTLFKRIKSSISSENWVRRIA